MVTRLNKCIGDDTKAAARQSPHCIKKTKNMIFNMTDVILTPYDMARSWHWFRQVRWLHPAMWHVALGSWQWIHLVAVGIPCNVALGWHVIEFARWQHPAMWQVALGWHANEFVETSAISDFCFFFNFSHITAVNMSFCTSLRNFIQIWPPSAEKNDVMLIFNLRHLGF